MKNQTLIVLFSLFTLPFSLFTLPSSLAQVSPSWISNGYFPNANSSAATTIEIDPSGNIMVAGSINDNNSPNEDIFVIKQNAGGEVLWLQTYYCEDTISLSPNTLCIDNQGNGYITFMKHYVSTDNTYWSIAVQKYDATDGTIIWTSELADADFNAFEWQVKPTYMTIDDSHLYVAGTKFEEGIMGSKMLIMKVDFDGNILWTATHNGSGIYSNSKSVHVDPAGNVYIAGDAWNESIDYCVVKFDPNGNLLWDAFLDGDVYHDTDIAQKVITDSDGNVYVTGYSQISGYQKDIITAKYDANGNFQWQKSYGNPGYRVSSAYYLDLSETGDLYVGGYSAYEDPYPGTGKDYILLKYNPAGDLLWDARWDHINNLDDHPYDFDQGPEGNIYICGTTMKHCHIWDFINVVKYNPQGDLVWDVCVPSLFGTPWEIAVIENDQFVVAAGSYDTIMVNNATTIKYASAPPVNYEADILDIYFSSQVAPPVIDYASQTVTATVHDTANLSQLVPFITISDDACMYPDDEVPTNFAVPVWYNVTSFDETVEKWWYVIVEGGHVGCEEQNKQLFHVYPNPCSGAVHLRYQIPDKRYLISDLFEISGRRIKRLMNEEVMPGEYEMVVDVNDLPGGIYFIRYVAGNRLVTKKLIIK